MKLNLFKKIIISTCLVVTLIFTLVVPCFAGSTGGNERVMQPLFMPDTIVVSEGSNALLSDIPSTVCWSPGASSLGLNRVDLISPDSDYFDLTFETSNSDSTLLSGYGISYVRFDDYLNVQFYESKYFGFTEPNAVLTFPSIYLPYNIVYNNSAKLNWLASWVVRFSSSDNFSPAGVRISFNCHYIKKNGDSYTQSYLPVTLTSTVASADSSSEIGALIYDSLSSLSASDKQGGVVIDSLSVTYYDLPVGDSDDGAIEIVGTNKYCVSSSLGWAKAYDAWRPYRSVTINQTVNNDTVIGSITNGLGDIWRLRLFGEFSIGNLFTAIVGLSCFIWILKIFAGG